MQEQRLVFNQQKFESIQEDLLNRRAANRDRLDDWHAAREEFQRRLSRLQEGFSSNNKEYTTAYAAINAAWKAEQYPVEVSLASLDELPLAQRHFSEVVALLHAAKLAQRRSLEATANYNQAAASWPVLEAFARQHIKHMPNEDRYVIGADGGLI